MKRSAKVRVSPPAATVEELRVLISRYSSVHASLTGHIGWGICRCPLAHLLRDIGEFISRALR